MRFVPRTARIDKALPGGVAGGRFLLPRLDLFIRGWTRAKPPTEAVMQLLVTFESAIISSFSAITGK